MASLYELLGLEEDAEQEDVVRACLGRKSIDQL